MPYLASFNRTKAPNVALKGSESVQLPIYAARVSGFFVHNALAMCTTAFLPDR